MLTRSQTRAGPIQHNAIVGLRLLKHILAQRGAVLLQADETDVFVVIGKAQIKPAARSSADYLVERGEDRHDLNVFAARRGKLNDRLKKPRLGTPTAFSRIICPRRTAARSLMALVPPSSYSRRWCHSATKQQNVAASYRRPSGSAHAQGKIYITKAEKNPLSISFRINFVTLTTRQRDNITPSPVTYLFDNIQDAG